LIDLPEDALLFADLLGFETLLLESVSIPVLICVEFRDLLPGDTGKVYPRIVLSMAVSIDVAIGTNSANVSPPWFFVAVPPVLCQSLNGWHRRIGVREGDLGNTCALDIVNTSGAVVEQEVEDPCGY
jgi:hypothetical protein